MGDAGLYLVAMKASLMMFGAHPTTDAEVGIDCNIELFDADGNSTEKWIAVQSKAESGRFDGEDETSFYFKAKPNDVLYWFAQPLPVILVCSRPKNNEAYWVAVHEALSARAETLADGKIYVSKADIFGSDACAERLHQIASEWDEQRHPVRFALPRTRTVVAFSAAELLRDWIAMPRRMQEKYAAEVAEMWPRDWVTESPGERTIAAPVSPRTYTKLLNSIEGLPVPDSPSLIEKAKLRIGVAVMAAAMGSPSSHADRLRERLRSAGLSQ